MDSDKKKYERNIGRDGFREVSIVSVHFALHDTEQKAHEMQPTRHETDKVTPCEL
jgi:hypothetical protein